MSFYNNGAIIGKTMDYRDSSNSGIWDLETIRQSVRIIPDYINYSGGQSGTYGLTFDKPSGTTQGDLMFCNVLLETDTVTVTPPSGWTKYSSEYRFGATGQRQTYQSFYKIAGGSEPTTYTFSHSAGSGLFESPICVRIGLNTFDPDVVVDANNNSQGVSTTTRTNSGVTTSVYNCTLLLFSVSWNSTPSSTPSGMSTIAVWDGSHSDHFQEGVAKGATGTKSLTQSTSNDYGMQLFAIKSKSDPGMAYLFKG
ncbi:hypothetical protein EBZ38_06430 [bacterium]|nr:hypothetical protein [bacterium]